MVVDKTSYGIDFYIETLKGQKTGHSQVHLHGHNDNVDITWTDIWNKNARMVYLSSAETMNIVSNNVNDTSAGTGARTVKVIGLDNNFNDISETVTMNGTTNVLTTLSYRRVLDLDVLTVGSNLENLGQIKATSSSTTEDQSIIEAEFNHSLNGRFTTPAGKFGILANYELDVSKDKDCIIAIRAGNGEAVLTAAHTNNIFQSTVFSPVPDLIIPPKTDIIFRAKGVQGIASVSVAFNMVLIDEGLVDV